MGWAYSLCNVCRIMCLILSGLAALRCRFKHTSSLSMTSAALFMSVIFGWGLGCNDSLRLEPCSSCCDFWASDFKPIGVVVLYID